MTDDPNKTNETDVQEEMKKAVDQQMQGMNLPPEAIESIQQITAEVSEALKGGDMSMLLLEEADKVRDQQLNWIADKLIAIERQVENNAKRIDDLHQWLIKING